MYTLLQYGYKYKYKWFMFLSMLIFNNRRVNHRPKEQAKMDLERHEEQNFYYSDDSVKVQIWPFGVFGIYKVVKLNMVNKGAENFGVFETFNVSVSYFLLCKIILVYERLSFSLGVFYLLYGIILPLCF